MAMCIIFLPGIGLLLVEYLFSSLLSNLLNQFSISHWNNPASLIKNTEIIRSNYVPFYCCFCLEGKKIQQCYYGKTSAFWT